MAGGRRAARTLAFQTLFEAESRPGEDLKDVLALRIAGLEEDTGERVSPRTSEFALRLAEGCVRERDEINGHIQRVAPIFPVSQLPRTDRIILEVAIFELFHDRQSPTRVVINEAVEIAKRFGGDNSGRFVNGVLGTITEVVGPG